MMLSACLCLKVVIVLVLIQTKKAFESQIELKKLFNIFRIWVCEGVKEVKPKLCCYVRTLLDLNFQNSLGYVYVIMLQ